MRTSLVILLLSIVSIVLFSLLLFCKLNSYKADLRLRLDPLEESCPVLKAKPKEDGFWIIGDSRAASWETSQLDFIRINSRNLGIGGQTSSQVLERFRKNLFKSRPYCVLIQVGINDLKGIGLLQDKFITQSCTNNILQILETCENYGIKAIYSSIFPTGKIELIRRPFWEPTTIDSLMKVNNVLKDYCQEKGHIYFDTYALLESQNSPGIAEKEYQLDFLHINTRGYEHISRHLQLLLSSTDEDWVRDLIE